ncbi:hypothetical protein ACSMXN_05855 [Jatrophihabitans sp. DSM 45814]
MTWLLWRQHRVSGALAAGLLAIFGVLLWVTGVTMAHDYRTALSECGKVGTDCSGLNLFQGDGAVIDLVNLTVAIPVLIGVFWGATSVGREYDAGTNLLVWTQSVTRRRWMWAKVLTLLSSSLLVGAALSGMVTWWSGTQNSYHQNRFDPLQFDIQGLMPASYTLFAAALGLLAGVLWRRVLPAIVTTVVGFVAVRFLIENYLRQHYAKAVTTIDPAVVNGDQPRGAWSLHGDLLHNGSVVSGPIPVPRDCIAVQSRAEMTACLQRNGYHFSQTYQPANRYWTFQWIESGIFVAIAAVLVAIAVITVRRRDA